ncbi:phytoene desaturase [Ramaria rubella]|nr:phytoene desaturase [Ramaria rubella]
MLKSPKVVVVGAGVGGVAVAARLSKAGLEVTVLEKNSFTGGRCSLLRHEGYRFDQGPSLLLLPQIFRSTFADLGTSLEEQDVHLLKCDPNYVVHFHDGNTITLSTDLSSMKEEVEKWEGKDGFERYLAFLTESHRHYEISVAHVLNKNFTSIFSLLRPSFLRHVLTLHPFDSVYSRASRYFRTDRLRRAFTFGTMYMGVSPFDSPGTYSLLQYTELAQGIWYPKGGFHKVIEALAKVSESQGVEFRLSTAVEKILVSNNKTTGVKLSNGECIQADIVVVNADLVYSYRNLLPPTKPTFTSRLQHFFPILTYLAAPTVNSLAGRTSSCSSLSFYWSMDRVIPQLGAHNIFLAEDFQESFDEIFKFQQMPLRPSFYVHVPSRADPSAAPNERDALVILVPVGCLSETETEDNEDLEMVVERARKIVLLTLERQLGLSGIQDWIVHEILNTPLTWRKKFNLNKGAILGLAHNFFNVLSFRPRTRHSTIDGLFFVGASTHPGTGVPICLSGAKITSEQILAELGISTPWSDGLESGSRFLNQSKIDQIRTVPIFTTDRILLLFILSILLSCTLGRLSIWEGVIGTGTHVIGVHCDS